MHLKEIRLSSRCGEYRLVFDFGGESYCFRFNEGAEVKEVGEVIEYGGVEISKLLEKLKERAEGMSREELEDFYMRNHHTVIPNYIKRYAKDIYLKDGRGCRDVFED